jgi:hypothetical protein
VKLSRLLAFVFRGRAASPGRPEFQADLHSKPPNRTSTSNSGRLRRAGPASVVALLAALLLAPPAALAHNPDTSYARVTTAEREVAFRFTYDLFTLQKITPLDADGDRRISRAELQRGLPAIHAFLKKHIAVDLDDEAADFGAPVDFVWPPEAGDAIAEADYHKANGLIHFNFRRAVADTPENLVLAFRWLAPLNRGTPCSVRSTIATRNTRSRSRAASPTTTT